MLETFHNFLANTIGLSKGAQYKIIASILVIFFLWLFQVLVLRIVWRRTTNVKIRYQWRRGFSLIMPVLGVILVAGIWLPAFEKFGAFLGLFSAGLAIALKDPLTNLAGWLFILFRKPFSVGDRVQIGEHSGDIIDIRLFQFTLLEVGNWVDADQSTGRIIHLPNGKVFQQSQANYSAGFEYIWNEIQVNITFESNWQEAKKILQEIIDKRAEKLSTTAKKEIEEASKNFMIYYKYLTPIVYTKVKEFGVRLTIRYLCNPRKRRSSENEIWEDILKQFNQHKNIFFAYPTTRFYKFGENPNTSL